MFSRLRSLKPSKPPEADNAPSRTSDKIPYEGPVARDAVNAPMSRFTIKGRTYNLTDLGIAPEFLQALPKEIREDVLLQATEALSNRNIYTERPKAPPTSRYAHAYELPSDSSTVAPYELPSPIVHPNAGLKSRRVSSLERPLSSNDVYIAVMGITGSGKSTFISKLVGDDVRVGHALQSCTAEVFPYAFMHNSTQRVYLLDTPGFDDTNRSDTDVLKDVATFLSRMYAGNIKLAGIIYLHRITDNRMGGSAMRNLRMFKKLCGDKYFQNIILATSMWERLQTQAQGEQNESQLLAERDWWGGMHEQGSKVFRHMDTIESAMHIISYLVNTQPAVLRIQEEMVDEHRDLVDTSAGREVEKDLQELREKFISEIKSLREEQMEALQERDEFMANELKQQEVKMEQRLLAADKARQDLKVNFERLTRDSEMKYLGMIKDLREESRSVHESIKREKRVAQKERERQEAAAMRDRDLQEQERIRWQEDVQAMNRRFEQQASIDREQRDEERRRWQQEIADRHEQFEKQRKRERDHQNRDRQERQQLQTSSSKIRAAAAERNRFALRKDYENARAVYPSPDNGASPDEAHVNDSSSTLSGSISPERFSSDDEAKNKGESQSLQRPDTRRLGTGAALLIAMAGVVTLNPVVTIVGIGGAILSSQAE